MVEPTGWMDPTIYQGESGIIMSAFPAPAIHRIGEPVPPVQAEVHGTRAVFDFGQNLAGWCRLALPEGIPAGITLQLRHAEILDPSDKHQIYVDNLRGARASDFYTTGEAGRGSVTWEPEFTSHGFRYAELVAPDQATMELLAPAGDAAPLLRAVVLRNTMREACAFECDNALVSQIFRNVQWGAKGNYQQAGVPTDCPQRDERFGYTGDGEAFCQAGSLLFDMRAYFNCFLVNIADSQDAHGMISGAAPQWGGPGSGEGPYVDQAGWSDAMVMIPYVLWKVRVRVRVRSSRFEFRMRLMRFVCSSGTAMRGP